MKRKYLGHTTTILLVGSIAIGLSAGAALFFLDHTADRALIALNWTCLMIAVVTGTWLHSRRAEALAKVQYRAIPNDEIEAYYE